MSTLYEPKLILPESVIGDEKIRALVEGIDEQLRALSNDSKRVLHLPRLNELTGTILDLLAWQFHVDFYDSRTLTDEQKRNLIRESIANHRRKGTVWSVAHVATQFFKEPKIIELGEYQFRIKSKGYKSTQEAFPTFVNMLYDAKNVRSWLTDIELDLSEEKPVELGAGVGLALSGYGTINHARFPHQRLHAPVGTSLVWTGEQTIAPFVRPKPQLVKMHVGTGLFVGGTVIIDSEDKPQLRWIRENPTADCLIAGIGIARGYDFFNLPPEFDLQINRVKLFFGFQFSKHRRYRGVSLLNPRDDLTREQIKEAGQYAVDHKLIKNEAGEISDHVMGAAIKQYTVEQVLGEPYLPANTLEQDARAQTVLKDLRNDWT